MGKETVIRGKISRLQFEEMPWGKYARIFSDFGDDWNGHYARVDTEVCLETIIGNKDAKCVGIVDGGAGEMIFSRYGAHDKKIVSLPQSKTTMRYGLGSTGDFGDTASPSKALNAGFAFSVAPASDVIVRPLDEKLALFMVEGPEGGGAIEYKIVDPDDTPKKPYEYESLAQEIITYPHDGKLGLLRFTFAGQGLPIHRHPHSARIIKGIAGEGFTYLEPHVYPMSADDFIVFPLNHIHTNGPKPASVSEIWAFQMPWIVSKIDEENIGGSPQFVQYEGGYALPKTLWKSREDFDKIIEKLSKE